MKTLPVKKTGFFTASLGIDKASPMVCHHFALRTALLVTEFSRYGKNAAKMKVRELGRQARLLHKNLKRQA